MLINMDKKDKKNTIYKCDVCKKEITIKENNKIYIQTPKDKNMKKRYDICNECYKILAFSIDKCITKEI